MRLPRMRRPREPEATTRRLIVGLGNPGPKYRATRHNVGFVVVERLLDRLPPARSWNKHQADVFQIQQAGEQWLLVKPLTYMNLSGNAVAAVLRYYDVPLERLLVVCDDFNLPLGRLRFRRDGSHGGQKGLADIIAKLGSDEFARLRIGIAAPGEDALDHVLGTFAEEERPVMQEAVERAADGVITWCQQGIEAAMNAYNAAG